MAVEERERQLNLYGSSQEHGSLVSPGFPGELCPPAGLNPAHDCWSPGAECQAFYEKNFKEGISPTGRKKKIIVDCVKMWC